MKNRKTMLRRYDAVYESVFRIDLARHFISTYWLLVCLFLSLLPELQQGPDVIVSSLLVVI